MKGPQCRRGTETTDTEKKSQAVAAAPPRHIRRGTAAPTRQKMYSSALAARLETQMTGTKL